MPRPSALTRAKSEIQQALLQEGRAIHTRKDIADIFYRNRHAWALPQRVSINRFLDFVTKTKLLQAYDLQSHKYARSTTRYAHGEASPLAMAVTLSPRAYLSHGTALGLHGLIPLDETRIYLNIEQSPKPDASGRLTQAGLDRAFRAKQRQSEMIYQVNQSSIVQLSGKATDRLGVEDLAWGDLPPLPVTNLERSLIDAVVRPVYAGGPVALAEAYRNARGKLDPEHLEKVLKQLGHAYPYHQAIGFLLELSGHEPVVYERFRKNIRHRFYLMHGMKNPALSAHWSLYYPETLGTSFKR